MSTRIKRFKIDLRNACGYVDGEIGQEICRHLRRSCLFSDAFLYSFFDSSDLERVIATGSTRDPSDNVIYAFNKTQLHVPEGRSNCTVRARLKEAVNPCLAVYDGEKLTPAYIADSNYGYIFKSPIDRKKALVGIGRVLRLD